MAAFDAFLTALFASVKAADEPDSWAGLMTSALAGASHRVFPHRIPFVP